jgi:hypothetical protein
MLVNKVFPLSKFFHSIWILNQSSREYAQGRMPFISLWRIWIDGDHNNFSLMLVTLEVNMSQHLWVVLSDSLARGRVAKATNSLWDNIQALRLHFFPPKSIAAQRFHQAFAS